MKSWNRCPKFVLSLVVTVATALHLLAFETAVVNGITWTYTVSGGEVSLGGGSSAATAVRTSTTGALTIPSSLGGYPVTSIGAYAFFVCSGLKSVTIPDSVTSIGRDAFSDCSGLTSVTIPDSVTSIGSFAFSDCTNLTSVTIPASVTSIEGNAFYGCRLKSVTIPQYVLDRQIRNVFPSSSITNVFYSSVITNIGKSAFSGCSGLTSVTIPDSVTSIGSYAFYGCSGLKSVTIPASVTSIGEEAFYNCSGLTSVTIPASVTSIGKEAFTGCINVCEVTVPGHRCGIPFNKVTNLVISAGRTSIGSYAFYNWSGLTSVTIPDSVTSIEGYAFYNCSGLTSVTIPDSVTSISSSAFSGCSDALFDTTTIAGVKLFDGWVVGWTDSLWGDLDLTCIRGIASDAFYGCSGLTSVTIGNSVTNICRSAFYNCSGLTSVTILDSVTSIGSYAFYNCSGLTSVTIGNSVTSIGYEAFYNCSGLKSVTIPDSVTSIGSSAFYNCSGLKSVCVSDLSAWCEIEFRDGSANPLLYAHNLYLNGSLIRDLVIPDGVTGIRDCAFSGCSGLTRVTIPDSVTSIGTSAFSGCSGLTSATIGNGVAGIGDYAFSGCDGLVGVTIGSGVTNIGSQAFYKYSSSYYDAEQLCLRMLGDRPTFASGVFGERDAVVFVDEDNATWKMGGVLPESFAVDSSTVKLHPWNVPTLITGVARSSFVYDGTEKKPNLTCLYGDTELLEALGAEYDVEYFDNVNAGTGRVVITGKNGFPGRAEYTFTIEKATVYPPYISGKTYAGGTMTADVPSSDLWRVVSNDGGVDAGDYDVTLELTDPANYKWSGSDSAQVTRTFTIGRKSINGASVELGPSLTFTGEVQTQTVHGVTLNGVAVTFDVFDNDVRDVGTYTLTVYGTGNYAGSAQASFSVAQMVIDPPTLAEKAYTGGNLTADVPESQWYTVSANFGGTDPGIYWVMLTLADEANTRWSITGDRMAVVPFEIVSPGGDDPTPPGPPAPATYTVTYRPGTYGTGALQTATKTEGVVLALKGAIFTREGYTQTGWSTTDGGAKAYGLGSSYAVNAAVTLFPFWTENASPEPPGPPSVDTVTVTFNANEGSGDATRQIEKGAAIGELPVARRTGYTFAGWWTATEQATVKTKVTKNVTYYAKWMANKYTIKFYANGGKGAMKTISATYGNSARLTANAFKRTGYKFAGWAKSKSGAVAYKDKASVKNLTAVNGKTVALYAVWTANKYKIKFNKNGGKGSMKTLSATYDKVVKLTANAFKRTGYKFSGWAKTKKGKVAYKNKAKVKNLTATNSKTVTLYAVWKKAKSGDVKAAATAAKPAAAVAAVPAWAVGTFYGGDEGASTTITVSKVGKVSGKVLFENGGRWTIVGKASGQRIAAVVTDADGNSAEVAFAIVKTPDGRCRIESADGSMWAE